MTGKSIYSAALRATRLVNAVQTAAGSAAHARQQRCERSAGALSSRTAVPACQTVPAVRAPINALLRVKAGAWIIPKKVQNCWPTCSGIVSVSAEQPAKTQVVPSTRLHAQAAASGAENARSAAASTSYSSRSESIPAALAKARPSASSAPHWQLSAH